MMFAFADSDAPLPPLANDSPPLPSPPDDAFLSSIRRPHRRPPPACATSTPHGSPSRLRRASPDADSSSFVSTITTGTQAALKQQQEVAYQRALERLANDLQQQELSIGYEQRVMEENRRGTRSLEKELASQRKILLARLRIGAMTANRQRLVGLLREAKTPPRQMPKEKQTLQISNLTVWLNRSFCSSALLDVANNETYAFFVVIHCNYSVDGTALCSLIDGRGLRVRHLQFAEIFTFANLPVDFHIRLEVYGMRVNLTPPVQSCAKTICNRVISIFSPSRRAKSPPRTPGKTPSKNGTLIFGLGPSSSLSSSNSTGIMAKLTTPKRRPNEPVVSRSRTIAAQLARLQSAQEFVACGHVDLRPEMFTAPGPHTFYLDNVEYPLEGTVEMRLTPGTPSVSRKNRQQDGGEPASQTTLRHESDEPTLCAEK